MRVLFQGHCPMSKSLKCREEEKMKNFRLFELGQIWSKSTGGPFTSCHFLCPDRRKKVRCFASSVILLALKKKEKAIITIELITSNDYLGWLTRSWQKASWQVKDNIMRLKSNNIGTSSKTLASHIRSFLIPVSQNVWNQRRPSSIF